MYERTCIKTNASIEKKEQIKKNARLLEAESGQNQSSPFGVRNLTNCTINVVPTDKNGNISKDRKPIRIEPDDVCKVSTDTDLS